MTDRNAITDPGCFDRNAGVVDLTVGGEKDRDPMSQLFEGNGKRAADIGESAGLCKRSRFT